MIASMVFSLVAAALVYLAGRRDVARDPRLTGTALLLVVLFPLLFLFLPKFALIPGKSGEGSGMASMGWIGWIWGLGFAVAMFRLAMAAAAIARWRRCSHLVERAGRIEIRELRGLKGPVAAGVFRPIVFVPQSWNQWPESTRKIVLDHETAHHDRHDPLWRWLAEIAAALNWFNPLVWWMVRRWAIQCEFACDTSVVRSGVAAGEYAALLCDLAEDTGFRGPALAMAERSSLELRVSRLVRPLPSRRIFVIPLMIGFVLASAFALASIGPAASKPEGYSGGEIRTRWTADPFPGELGGKF